MQALSINPLEGEVKEIEIQMQANTVYSFFNSILIDELLAINEHVVYADANALSKRQKAYFLGERLVLGNALVHAKAGMEDRDVVITKEELESLINLNVNKFYLDVLELLSSTNINLYRTFIVLRGDEKVELNAEWVLYTFNIADERTQEYFVSELQKAISSDQNIEEYIKKMATLALNAAGN
ncbi:MAG: hypothetical protein U9N39_08380 [Campylobacterota bacterium]|nr:hypothetical protein [Campylobacterota bacterium]